MNSKSSFSNKQKQEFQKFGEVLSRNIFDICVKKAHSNPISNEN